MNTLFWLSDEAWSAVEPCLPKNQPGAGRVDDRRVISSGIGLYSRPAAAGRTVQGNTVRTRRSITASTAVRRRLWVEILEALVASGVLMHATAIDSTM
jgi:transposase